MESHRKQVKIRSRSARHEGRVHNVNETKHSAVGSARSMENIAHENLISSPSDSPTSVAASTRSQTRSRQRNSKSVSVGSDTSQFGDRLMQYYISKHWLNRFTTFADPGPITNSDFLCQHSSKIRYSNKSLELNNYFVRFFWQNLDNFVLSAENLPIFDIYKYRYKVKLKIKAS